MKADNVDGTSQAGDADNLQQSGTESQKGRTAKRPTIDHDQRDLALRLELLNQVEEAYGGTAKGWWQGTIQQYVQS
jgi:hypothetical protein